MGRNKVYHCKYNSLIKLIEAKDYDEAMDKFIAYLVINLDFISLKEVEVFESDPN